MTVSELKRLIMDGNIGKLDISSGTENFYIFSGVEIEVQNIYARKMAEVCGKELRRPDSVADVLNTRASIFASQSYCYFVRDDASFIANESLWDKITNLLGDNILILAITNLDKRSVFYKHFKDKIIVFEPLVDSTIIRHIRDDIDLSKNNIKTIIDGCDSDYSQVLLEVDKVRCYAESRNITPDEAFDVLWESGQIYQSPQDRIFDFVSAIGQCKPKTSYRLFTECVEHGESALKMILLLYNQFKHMLQVQSCESTDVEKTTGLSSWEIKLVQDKLNIYHNWELIDFMRVLKDLETKLKTGEIEETFVMDYLLVYVLGG